MSEKYSPHRLGSKVAKLPNLQKEEVIFYQQTYKPMPIGMVHAAQHTKKGVNNKQ